MCMCNVVRKINFPIVEKDPNWCPGLYCSRIKDEQGNLTSCGVSIYPII